jgi:predicted DCC family thiol-disulfide oxidoreductase YuxK
VRPAVRADTDSVPPAVFLYDGDCAFCSSCARWLQRWVPSPVPLRPWQFVDVGALGLTPAECDTAVQWVDGPRRAAGPAAIAALLRTSGLGWRVVGRLLGTRVGLALAWPPYRWVARNRDRMPGGTAACALPAAQRPGASDGGMERPLDRSSSL